jgi:hypothetical protein
MRATHTCFHMAIVMVVGLAAEAAADAAVIRVPRDARTIQAAVNRASDGDIITVAPGRYCGATIDREVHLIATWATQIVGCATPTISGLRAGFFLPDESASGSTITGFRFDGRGIADDDTEPLAFAIFARDAHGVIVDLNRIEGTIQGITNTRGDGWIIAGNVIHRLTLITRGGGDGIVLQQRDPALDRAAGNVVGFNHIDGRIPDGHAAFDMVGVLVIGQERPAVTLNKLAIPDNRRAEARGIGVLVTDICCGDAASFPTTHGAVIVGNDGRHSQFAVIVDRDASGGTGNSRQAVIVGNRGVVLVDGERQQVALVATDLVYAWPFE